MVEMAGGQFAHTPAVAAQDPAALEANLRFADLMICRAGCVSHDE